MALLSWPYLPARWRQTFALLTSAAGLFFLILAVNSEGLREAPTTSVFLLGAPYVTEHASASASLPYYVLTAVCLLLGTAGLAVSDPLAQRIRQHWMAVAVTLSIVITGVRFCLEKVAAPPAWARPAGITLLAPAVGAFFFLNLRRQQKTLGPLVKALALYAIVVRGWIATLYVLASAFRLGSHFDQSGVGRVLFAGHIYHFVPGSFRQVFYLGVLPQVVVWPVFTILAGLLGAAMLLALQGQENMAPQIESDAGTSPVGKGASPHPPQAGPARDLWMP